MVSRSGIRIGMQGIGTAVEWLLEPRDSGMALTMLLKPFLSSIPIVPPETIVRV